MARIRSIKPEFFTSEQVAECSTNARLLFVGMWCFCDDQGIHPDSPARLKMEVFPSDDLTKSDVEKYVEELVAVGLIQRYEVEGQKYLIVTGWSRHQKIDKPSKKYPLPLAEQSPNDTGSLPEDSANVRRVLGDGKDVDVDVDVEGKKDTPPSPRKRGRETGPALGLEFLLTSGVPEQAAKDWLAVRAKGRAPLTESAWNGLVREAKRAGISPAQAVQIAAEKGWRGFEAAWVADRGGRPGTPSPAAPRETVRDVSELGL